MLPMKSNIGYRREIDKKIGGDYLTHLLFINEDVFLE